MSTVPAQSTGMRIPLGRALETERLDHAVAGAVAGEKRALLLLGGAGIGKTTLLHWVCDRAAAAGCLTAIVRAPAAAGLPPRFPIGELLEGLIESCEARHIQVPDPLRRVVDTLRGQTSAETYPAQLPQIAHAVEAVGAYAPLGIFLDDFQWAPPEATNLLVATLRVIDVPLVFVAAARLRAHGEETPSSLPEPTADLWIDHLEVRGLEAEAVSALAVEMLGGTVLPSLTHSLHARTLGNPLFVVEMLRHWREDALTQVGGYWGVREEAERESPRSLREMVAARLAKLDAGSTSVASALAVLGRDAWFDEVRGITGMPTDELVEVLCRLTEDGVLADDARPTPRYRMAHPLYATSLLATMGTTRTAALHGRIFEALGKRREQGGAVAAAELAHHAVTALERPPGLRALLSDTAAEAEDAGSYEEAATWYEHLADEARDDAELLLKALEGQARATTNFDPKRAADLFTRGLVLADKPDVQSHLLVGRAFAHRILGEFDASQMDLTAASSIASTNQFQVRHGLAVIEGIRGNIHKAELLLRKLAHESRGSPDYPKAIGHLAQALFVRGEVLQSRELAQSALELCQEEHYRAYLRANLTWALTLLGEWTHAERLLTDSIKKAMAAGDLWNLNMLLCNAARLNAWKGEFPLAFDYIARANHLARHLDNPACQIEILDAMGVALLESRQLQEAVRALAHAAGLIEGQTERRDPSFTVAALSEAHLLLGEAERARAVLDIAATYLDQGRTCEVILDRMRASLCIADHRPDLARELLRKWMARPSPLLVETAAVFEVWSLACRDLAERDEALLAAETALEIYGRLGARERQRRMRAWVVSLQPHRRGRPPSPMPAGLTHREVEILRLVITGMTNRQIAARLVVAEATVKKHVEHLISKMAVSRRTELGRRAAKLGIELGLDAPESS